MGNQLTLVSVFRAMHWSYFEFGTVYCQFKGYQDVNVKDRKPVLVPDRPQVDGTKLRMKCSSLCREKETQKSS